MDYVLKLIYTAPLCNYIHRKGWKSETTGFPRGNLYNIRFSRFCSRPASPHLSFIPSASLSGMHAKLEIETSEKKEKSLYVLMVSPARQFHLVLIHLPTLPIASSGLGLRGRTLGQSALHHAGVPWVWHASAQSILKYI